MAKQCKVLVLTDSALHGPHEGIYVVLQSLIKESLIDSVHVCDRNDDDNLHFYRDRLSVGGLHVFEVDEWYAYETRHAHMNNFQPLDTFDAVWMFLDHPVSPEFLRYFKGMFPKAFIMNCPMGVAATSTKAVLKDLKREIDCIANYIPPIKICTSVQDVENFRKKYGNAVLKALRDFGGAGVKRYKTNGDTDIHTAEDVQAFLDKQGGQCLAMRYLDNDDQSDKRTLVFRGQILGSVLRRPARDGWLCNIASGGSAEISAPNIEEKTLIDVIDPWLQSRGVYYYGIDTLKDESGRRVLSEINTLNIGGAKIVQELTGEDISHIIASGFCDLLNEHLDLLISNNVRDQWSDLFSDFG